MFDKFIIRQWQQGYTLEVQDMRPSNAPRYRHTAADRKRILRANKMNMELNGKYFTFEELFAKIKELQKGE